MDDQEQIELDRIQDLFRQQDVVDLSFVKQFDMRRYADLNYLEVCKFLCMHGADINSMNSMRQTLLLISAATSKFSMTEWLLDNGASVNINSANGDTSLIYAVLYSRVNIVKRLIEMGVSVNKQGFNQNSPLHITSNLEMAKCLIDAGADLNCRDDIGNTPIMSCCSEFFDLIHLLVTHNANINDQSNNGNTILHNLVAREDLQLLISCLDFGADRTITNNKNLTPLDHAVRNHVFLSKSSEPNLQNMLITNEAIQDVLLNYIPEWSPDKHWLFGNRSQQIVILELMLFMPLPIELLFELFNWIV